METRINNALKSIRALKNSSKKIVKELNKELNDIANAKGIKRTDDDFDNYDPDSSPLAWMYYTIFYPLGDIKQKMIDGLYGKFADNVGLRKSNGRIYASFEISQNDVFEFKKYEKANQSIELAGDCAFNFNEKKIAAFTKKIVLDKKATEIQKERMLTLLLHCYYMHHTVFNFSLVPEGLNNFKGRGYDRLDNFLHWIKDFFDKKEEATEHLIFKARGGNKQELCNFLTNNINSFENYCKRFYHIDSKKIKEYEKLNVLLGSSLNNQGKIEIKPIVDCSSLLNYIELAIEFWKLQANNYTQNTKPKGDE